MDESTTDQASADTASAGSVTVGEPATSVMGPLSNGASVLSGQADGKIDLKEFFPVAGIYVALRAALFICNVLAANITRARNWLAPFTAWDGHWYTQVAQHWYGATALAASHLTYAAGGFEPGWPALIKLGTFAGLSFPGSAFVMSILVGGATSFAVWLLATELMPESSRLATLAVLIFPGAALAFGIAYSEVLSIGCVAATLYFLIRRNWLAAGVLGMVATATSSMAVVVFVACFIEAGSAIWRHKDYRALSSLILPPIGFLGFAAYLGYLAKDPLYWWKLQRQAWGAKIDIGFIFHWARLHTGSGWGMFWLAALGLVVLVYLLTIALKSSFPLSVKVYCGAIALMILINPALGPKPRFLLWMFPALLLLPRNLKPKTFQAVLILMAWLLPVLLIAYTTIGNTIAQP